MDAFVLDVSSCLPWCCEDETTPASEEMLEWANRIARSYFVEILKLVGHPASAYLSGIGERFIEQLATLNFKMDGPPHIADFPRLHFWPQAIN